MHVSEVPSQGPLAIGAIYQRSALHARFGGNNTAGIVPSLREPAVLLFHTEEEAHQFYGDGTDENGVYWYSGMGADGDMDWNHANRAVRDHNSDGKDLLLFERFQRQGGYWRFAHLMHCLSWREETRPDRKGVNRKAIIFGLIPVEETEQSFDTTPFVNQSLSALRQLAVSSAPSLIASSKERVQEVYLRSAAVKQYVLTRAAGICEACKQPASFKRADGTPYLESHHIDRLSDGGPDHPSRVAGICPNCHRRCHYGIDAATFNGALRERVLKLEMQLASLPGSV